MNALCDGERMRSGAKAFALAAGIFLLLTAAAKIVSALGSSKMLNVDDPVFHIQFRFLLLGVGIIEAAIGAKCLFAPAAPITGWLLAWLSTNILAYRIGLKWLGWKRPCNCLGNLTDALHMSPQVVDRIMIISLALLIGGSYAILISRYLFSRNLSRGVNV